MEHPASDPDIIEVEVEEVPEERHTQLEEYIYTYIRDFCARKGGRSRRIAAARDSPIEGIFEAVLRSLAENSDVFSKATQSFVGQRYFNIEAKWAFGFEQFMIQQAYNAIRHNDIATFERVMQRERLEVTARHPDPQEGRTMLGLAVEEGKFGLVQVLVGKGADCNQVCGAHGSALHAAAALGHTEILKFFLDQANGILELKNHLGQSILQVAQQSQEDETVEFLMARELKLQTN